MTLDLASVLLQKLMYVLLPLFVVAARGKLMSHLQLKRLVENVP